MKDYEVKLKKDPIKKYFIEQFLDLFDKDKTVPKIKNFDIKKSSIEIMCEVNISRYPHVAVYKKDEYDFWVPVKAYIGLKNLKEKHIKEHIRKVTFTTELEPGTYKVGNIYSIITAPYRGKSIESIVVK